MENSQLFSYRQVSTCFNYGQNGPVFRAATCKSVTAAAMPRDTIAFCRAHTARARETVGHPCTVPRDLATRFHSRLLLVRCCAPADVFSNRPRLCHPRDLAALVYARCLVARIGTPAEQAVPSTAGRSVMPFSARRLARPTPSLPLPAASLLAVPSRAAPGRACRTLRRPM